MKKIYLSTLIIFVLVSVFNQETISSDQIFQKSLPRAGQMYYVQGEFLVKFKLNVSKQTIDSINSTHGVSTIYISPYTGIRRLSVPAGKTVADMVEIYQANTNVEYAEANYIAYAMKAPNDELYPNQWHLYNVRNGGINVESAWSISTGLGAIVAILDTGIAYEDYSEKYPGGTSYQKAPDLVGTFFIAGYDFVNNDDHPNDDSISGHGTHIAGIIAQSTLNGLGTAGIAFNSFIMPVKVLNKNGAGTYADIAEGIMWATDNGAHVINMGFGGTEPSMALESAIAYSYNHGVTLVAAAGNDGIGGICYPAAYDDYVIAVGATRFDETLVYYSSYGVSLDLVAPGGDLNIDQNGDEYGDGILQQTYKIDGNGTISWGYSFMEGTSMAAAHVSGVAALIAANGNATSPAEVRLALESTAKDKGAEGWDIKYGWGIVDAFAALQWTASETEMRLGAQALNADFSGGPTTGLTGTTVSFSDQSSGDITSWSWDFGDGGSSSDPNPSNTYASEGAYTVSLTVTDSSGSDTETKETYVKIYTAQRPIADFSSSNDENLTVRFTDNSGCRATLTEYVNGSPQTSIISALPLGGITSWSWSFGDGVWSSERNPSHSYNNYGTYTVSLTISGPGGEDTVIKDGYVQFAFPAPVADFTAEPRSGNSPLTVKFTGTSTGNVTTRLWDFGDGTTATDQNPSHTYQNIGSYTVSLTISGEGGSDIETKEDYILVTPPGPVANFTAEPRSGYSPLEVQFTDISSGNITNRLWNFGDGTTSDQQNPSHTYQNIGSYTVSLTVSGTDGSDTKTMVDYIQVTIPAPVADFTAEPRNGNSPLSVQFTDTSTGNITSRLWVFGDGTTAIVQNPSHTYEKAGSYTVSLTVTGPGGSDTKTIEDYIQVTTPAPVANFTAEPRSGNSPLTVQFTGTSTGNITSRLWNFGDETTSTERYPSHTYQNAGFYTVSLTVTGPGGSDTKTMVDYIQVTTPAPVANFTAEPRSGNSPLIVQFTGTSTGNITSRLWDFGDETTSTERYPSHTYQNAGSYTVSLTVTGPGGSDTKTMVDYIQVTTPAPVANFTADPRSGNSPLTVQFTGTSTGIITSRLWDFGDETTSTERFPSHTYVNPGSYTVSLTVTGPGGSDTKTVKDYIQVTSPPPVANFTAEPRNGNSPLVVQFTDTSKGNITNRLWNFGDGITATVQNPPHTYLKAGSYTVSLTVTGPGGSNTKTILDYIQVTTPPPIANFTAEPRSGYSPLVVQFTGTSTGNITDRLWNFGDGTTSTEKNPIHTYTSRNKADFTVSLTVTGPGGTDTETKTDYISLNVPPVKVNINLSKTQVLRTWYIVTANITIKQNVSSGLPIAGAIVEGTWAGDYNETVSGVTNANGEINFKTQWVVLNRTVTFTINRVIIDGKEIDFVGAKSASIRI